MDLVNSPASGLLSPAPVRRAGSVTAQVS